MSNGTDRKPDASGDLARYPVPRLLFYLFKKSFQGELVLQRPGQWDGVVYFREGTAVRADIPVSQDVLGRILLERGIIDEAALNESLQKLAAGEGLQGQILLKMEAINAEQLAEGLLMQVHRKLIRLFPFTDVKFQLFSGEHDWGKQGEDAKVRADPYYVIYHGVRSFFDDERLKAEMTRMEGKAVTLTSSFDQVRGRYMFGNEEDGLVTLLSRSTLQLDDVRNVSDLGPLETEMLLYSLLATDQLEMVDAATSSRAKAYASDPGSQAPVVAVPAEVGDDGVVFAPPPPINDMGDDDVFLPAAKTPTPVAEPIPGGRNPSGGIKPLPVEEDEDDLPDSIMAAADVDGQSSLVGKTKAANALRREIVEKFTSIEEATHYEVLGVSQDCPTDQIREAYFQLAKVFHPDRASALGLRDVVDKAEEIFTRVSEAHNILSDENSRQEYNEKLEGKDTRADVLNAVEAEFIFQKGIFHFRKKNYKEALNHFEQAYKLNPQEGEHLAYMAWTIYTDPARDRARTWETVLEQMEKSLTISPNSAQCHYFMGELYAAKGNDKKALKFFNKTLEINPDHLEAERHLRLIKIRQDKKRASEEKGLGFLTRMFKKEDPDDKKKKKKGSKKKGRW